MTVFAPIEFNSLRHAGSFWAINAHAEYVIIEDDGKEHDICGWLATRIGRIPVRVCYENMGNGDYICCADMRTLKRTLAKRWKALNEGPERPFKLAGPVSHLP